jgi:hypothetical protein
MGALLIDAVVRDGDVHVTDAFYRTRRERFAKKIGDGVVLKIRIEPADEAIRYHQLKHLFGHIFAPTSKQTGETVADVAVRMKVAFMPDDGRTSLTELNYDELKAFTEAVEQDIRENDPESWDRCLEAMALYERRAS